jgi:hypothetical protein
LHRFVDPIGIVKVGDRSGLDSQIAEFLNVVQVEIQFFFSLCISVHGSSNSQWIGRIIVRTSSESSTNFPLSLLRIAPSIIPFQAVARFTRWTGEATIRVFTSVVETSLDPDRILASCNSLIILQSLVRRLISDSAPLSLAFSIVSSLFRRYPDLPPPLARLPSFLLSVLKSSAFSPGTLPQNRAHALSILAAMPPSRLALVASPALTDVTDHIACGAPPRPCAASPKSLWPARIFAMDDGISGWVWVGNEAPPALCGAAFGDEDPSAAEAIADDADEGRRLIQFLRKPARICVEGGRGASAFEARFVESEGMGLPALKAFVSRARRGGGLIGLVSK